MTVGNRARDGEPQTETLTLLAGGAIPAPRVVIVSRCEPGAVVTHGDGDETVTRVESDLDGPPVAMTKGVIEQRVDRLPDASGIELRAYPWRDPPKL